jgi:hypothetical protein
METSQFNIRFKKRVVFRFREIMVRRVQDRSVLLIVDINYQPKSALMRV